MIDIGVDLLCPTTSTTSLQMTCFTLRMAFTSSSNRSSSELSLMTTSALKSIVCPSEDCLDRFLPT